MPKIIYQEPHREIVLDQEPGGTILEASLANGIAPMLTGGALTLNHSQVTGNTAAHGGGIFNSGGTVTLAATSVTGNNPDNCEPLGTISGCTG